MHLCRAATANTPRSRRRHTHRCSNAARASAAAPVQKGDGVGVRFTAFTTHGQLVDRSESLLGDAYFVVGATSPPHRLPGLHEAVVGLALGAPAVTRRVTNPFGDRTDDALVRVPAVFVPPGIALGVQVQLGDGRAGVVVDLNEKECVVDANHPYAGKDLDITCEVIQHTPAARLQTATFGMGCFWRVLCWGGWRRLACQLTLLHPLQGSRAALCARAWCGERDGRVRQWRHA